MSKPIEIIIVDDDHDDQEFLKFAISEVIPESKIISFFNGSDVVAYISDGKHKPHVIFMDLNLPKLDGETATVTIRKNSNYINVPIIVLSTCTDPAKMEDLKRVGANEYYCKPHSIALYVDIVKEVNTKWIMKNIS